MAILYEEDFDELPEGQSPPANWINENMLNCEVDDVQAHSTPHSMYIKAPGVAGKCRHEEAAGFTTEKITIWVYFPSTTNYHIIAPQSTTGILDTAKTTFHLIFSIGNIEYNDGTTKDTGYDYTTGWHKIEIVHDFIAETEDVWYDGVKVLNGGAFRNSGSSCKSIHSFLNTACYWWLDDVQIGEGGEPCSVTPAQAGPMAGGVTI